MKTYILEFYGVWLGGYALVRAENEDDAKDKLFKSIDDEWLLNKAKSNDIGIIEIPDDQEMYMIWNGDY